YIKILQKTRGRLMISINNLSINSLIENELSDTHRVFVDLHNIQLAIGYAVGELALEVDEKRPLSAEILFGIRSILELSANFALERANHTDNFEREFLLKLKNRQEHSAEPSQESLRA
ncbi:MAG: hypothetical protein FWE57_11675, partial [Chitinispirillia bacterium]|nr:hypothetical protein [Chitinispirillia bacterium]